MFVSMDMISLSSEFQSMTIDDFSWAKAKISPWLDQAAAVTLLSIAWLIAYYDDYWLQ
jgi:hypothetical protein